MAKKLIANEDVLANKVVLRNVGVKEQKFYLTPAKDPKTGRFPTHVKPVDHNGYIILTEAERDQESRGEAHYIKESEVFEITDGKTYLLDDVFQKAEWEAIKYNDMIAEDRAAKNPDGTFKIDGDAKSWGKADLYIERPGVQSKAKVSKARLQRDAITYILDDNYDAKLIKAELLGRMMKNQSDDDVTEYLLQYAQKEPERIINMYTGDDFQLRVLFLHAKKNKVITYKNKMFSYGENPMSATEDGAITWLKQPINATLVKMIRKETYPELEIE